MKTTCNFCNKKAVFNLKHVNGQADCTGPAVQLGAEEKYFPTCFSCYRSSLLEAGQSPVDCWANEVLSPVTEPSSLKDPTDIYNEDIESKP